MKTDRGIYVKDQNTFYQWESGSQMPGINYIDRLMNTLLVRGLISEKTTPTGLDRNWRYMSSDEAKEKSIRVEVVYANQFVKLAATSAPSETKKSWGQT